MSYNWIQRVWKQLADDTTPMVAHGQVITVGDAVTAFRKSMYRTVSQHYQDMARAGGSELFQRQDDQVALFAHHLAIQTLTGIETHEYAPAKFINGGLIPLTSEVDEGTDVYVWLEQLVNSEGAKLLANDSDDVPMVELEGKQNFGHVSTFGAGFYYTRQDLRKQPRLRKALVNEKSVAVRETMDRKLNDLIVNGEAGTKFVGMKDIGLDHTATNTNWSGGITGPQAVDELRTLRNIIHVESDGIEVPDTLVMPLKSQTYLETTTFNATADNTTILENLKRRFPEIKRWEWAPEMDSAGADGGGAIFMYQNHPSRIRAEIPMPPTPMELEKRGRRFVTEMEGRYGGIILKRPRSFARLDGVENPA